MRLEEVRAFIEDFKTSDLTKFKLKYDDLEIELERAKEVVYTQQTVPVSVAPTMPVAPASAPSNGQDAPATITAPAAPVQGKTVSAPLVGVFYQSSSPDQDPFVQVGSRVKKGDVLCIIEAMKLMNEVEAEMDGEIVEILVGNEEMVEYGQGLFVIRA